jgi:hypothetical protein
VWYIQFSSRNIILEGSVELEKNYNKTEERGHREWHTYQAPDKLLLEIKYGTVVLEMVLVSPKCMGQIVTKMPEGLGDFSEGWVRCLAKT